MLVNMEKVRDNRRDKNSTYDEIIYETIRKKKGFDDIWKLPSVWAMPFII